MPLKRLGFLARAWADATGIAEGWDLADVIDAGLSRHDFEVWRYVILCETCRVEVVAERVLVNQDLSMTPAVRMSAKQDAIEMATKRFVHEHGCPHWERYQVLRQNPEVRTNVERVAAMLAAEARMPDADRDRTGFAAVIKNLEESIACRFLNVLSEMAIGVAPTVTLHFRDPGSMATKRIAVPAETVRPIWEDLLEQFHKSRPWRWYEDVRRAQESEMKAHAALDAATKWWNDPSITDEVVAEMRRRYGGWFERVGDRTKIHDTSLQMFWRHLARFAEEKWRKAKEAEWEARKSEQP